MRIKCLTLFDITKTDVSGRRNLLSTTTPEEDKARNQQRNFETILQIISLRSQPENISTPQQTDGDKTHWGKKYTKGKFKVWSFVFEVGHSSVFLKDGEILGNLIEDCSGVPMIVGLNESVSLAQTLDCTDDYRNIIFEVEND